MERYFFYLIIGRFVLPALFIGLLGAQLAAQEGIHNSSSDRKSNTLQIAWGVQYNRAQDLVFSPMIYESNAAWTLGLNYKKQKARGWYQLGFAYDDAKLSPETLITSPVFGTRARSESKQFALHFAYAGLMNDHQKFNIHLGVQLDVRFHQIDYAFGLGIEESYFFANSVSPLLNFAWRLGEKNRLETGFSLPLLSFIARPEYAIVDNRNIQGEEGIAYLYKKGNLSL